MNIKMRFFFAIVDVCALRSFTFIFDGELETIVIVCLAAFFDSFRYYAFLPCFHLFFTVYRTCFSSIGSLGSYDSKIPGYVQVEFGLDL